MQSKIQIHGEKNKLVVKLPEEESESSSGHKKTAPRATSSPVVIDLGTESDKSSKSANSSKSGRKTRNSSKRKADPAPDPKEAKKQKRKKKEEKKKTPKGASDKGKQNGSAPAKPTNDQPKEETVVEGVYNKQRYLDNNYLSMGSHSLRTEGSYSEQYALFSGQYAWKY